LLATQQLQQYEHALVRTQGGEQPDLIVQRTLQNLPGSKPQLRQLSQPSAFA
jgi:hypothetical protein